MLCFSGPANLEHDNSISFPLKLLTNSLKLGDLAEMYIYIYFYSQVDQKLNMGLTGQKSRFCRLGFHLEAPGENHFLALDSF